MTTINLEFASIVDDWVKATEARMEAVWKESTQRVTSVAANGVPIDLGFAKASIRASTESMPPIDPTFSNKENKTYPFDFGEISLVIAGAELGQIIYIGWTAAYIKPLEYGHSQQAPAGFVRLAAAQWPAIVSEVTQEAKSRASAPL